MSGLKITIYLDPHTVRLMDQFVLQGLFSNRSELVQNAVAEKLRRLQQLRLADECAKLQPQSEQIEAERFYPSEAEWPEY